MSVHHAGMSIPRFDVEAAKKLLGVPRPWSADDFICAGLFFRDYGERMLGVIEAARTVRQVFADRDQSVRERQHAILDLDLELEVLDV